MTRHLPNFTSYGRSIKLIPTTSTTHPVNNENPRFIFRRSDAVKILFTKEDRQTQNRLSLLFRLLPAILPFANVQEVYFVKHEIPSQSFDENGCDYFLFPTPGKTDHITIDIHYSLETHNGIHTEEVDLLDFKEYNDLPILYPIFQLPYQSDTKVTCTGFYVYVEVIYIDSSHDPEIFAPYVYSAQVTSSYGSHTTSPATKITSAIIEVKKDKSLQFHMNRLNIEQDTSVKARPKIHPKILNFSIPSVTLTIT